MDQLTQRGNMKSMQMLPPRAKTSNKKDKLSSIPNIDRKYTRTQWTTKTNKNIKQRGIMKKSLLT